MIDVEESLKELEALKLQIVQRRDEIAIRKQKAEAIRQNLLKVGVLLDKVIVPERNPRKEEAIKLWKAGKHRRIDIARQLKVSAKTITKYLKEEK